MLGFKSVAVAMTAVSVLGACSSGDESAGQPEEPANGAVAVPFTQARLAVETNATDGDAGLQLFLDHDPWKAIAVYRLDGTKILDISTGGVLTDYGLTELFWESSEPPFEEFPLAEFKKLFPPGDYRFTGTTIEGEEVESVVTLTHDFPAGPKILSPKEDSTVPVADVVVTWEPVTEPQGITIVGYQVIVTKEEEPLRVLSADLPATATRFQVPAEFLEPGVEFKLEVMAIEKNRNQTLSESTFKVS